MLIYSLVYWEGKGGRMSQVDIEVIIFIDSRVMVQLISTTTQSLQWLRKRRISLLNAIRVNL